jgi:hypothetical protein
VRRAIWHLYVVRAAVVFALALLFVAPAAPGPTISYWSVGKVLRRLDGTSIVVGARSVRIHSETTLCAGEGVSVRRSGVRMWRHFACTYTTFTGGSVDRDLDFRLHVRSAQRFVVSDAHWITGSR